MRPKNFDEFFNRHKHYLRTPADFNILECRSHTYCTNCPQRCGCPMRIQFYRDDISFEFNLQFSELAVRRGFAAYFGVITDEDKLFQATQDIRKKKYRELQEYPFYSFS